MKRHEPDAGLHQPARDQQRLAKQVAAVAIADRVRDLPGGGPGDCRVASEVASARARWRKRSKSRTRTTRSMIRSLVVELSQQRDAAIHPVQPQPRGGCEPFDLKCELIITAIAPVRIVLEVLLVDHGRERVVAPAQPAGVLAGTKVLSGFLEPPQRVGHDGVAGKAAGAAPRADAVPGTPRPTPSTASRPGSG